MLIPILVIVCPSADIGAKREIVHVKIHDLTTGRTSRRTVTSTKFGEHYWTGRSCYPVGHPLIGADAMMLCSCGVWFGKYNGQRRILD